jgi:hypothetical protein
MNTSGIHVQRTLAARNPSNAPPGTAGGAYLGRASKSVQPPPLQAVHVPKIFVAPPPLLNAARPLLKRSHQNVPAMQQPYFPFPPNAKCQSSAPPQASSYPIEAHKIIDDGKAVSDLCNALQTETNRQENSNTPSITHSTMFAQRSLTSGDIIKAIDEHWVSAQFPDFEIRE